MPVERRNTTEVTVDPDDGMITIRIDLDRLDVKDRGSKIGGEGLARIITTKGNLCAHTYLNLKITNGRPRFLLSSKRRSKFVRVSTAVVHWIDAKLYG